MKRWLCLLCLINAQAFAFTCYVTAVKGDCWKDFDVSIYVDNPETRSELTHLVIEKGKMWKRITFDCKQREALKYKASFQPKIWATNKQTVYVAKKIVYLPTTIQKGLVAWSVPVCFPTDFSEVPLPTTAKNVCDCSSTLKTIPPIPGQIEEQ